MFSFSSIGQLNVSRNTRIFDQFNIILLAVMIQGIYMHNTSIQHQHVISYEPQLKLELISR